MTSTADLANNLLAAAGAMVADTLAELQRDDPETYQAVSDLAGMGAVIKTHVSVSAQGLREVGIDIVGPDGEVTNLMTVADRGLDS